MSEFNSKDEGLVMFSFNNYFMSTIQQGIQAGHCWMDMGVKYSEAKLSGCSPADYDIISNFWDWARNHKTVNVRNAGDMICIREIITELESQDNPYPWGYFTEDATQCCQTTSVSIVIPEHVYAHNPAPQPDSYQIGSYSIQPAVHIIPKKLDTFDKYLYDLIKSTRHAQ